MFAAHRTYHLREGWIGKGLEAVAHAHEHAGNVFLAPDAPERFGIGPAMVAAMRFWLAAMGLITGRREPRGRHRSVSLTDFGWLIYHADPFLERVGTLWLLHTHLVKNRLLAPAWFWFFNSYASARSFEVEACLDALHAWVIASYPNLAITRTTLHKDLACLLRMYMEEKRVVSPEEGTVSPFSRLHLFTARSAQGQPRQYHLLPPHPDHLDPLVLLYALVAKQAEARKGTQEVSMQEALYEPGNVGRVVPLLTATMLLEGLMELRAVAPEWYVQVTRTDTHDLLTLPICAPEHILHRYYEQKGR
jgi:hypothetical protein